MDFLKKLFKNLFSSKNKGVYDETDITTIENPVANMQPQAPVKPFEGLAPVGKEHEVFNEQPLTSPVDKAPKPEAAPDTHEPAPVVNEVSAHEAPIAQGDFEKLLSEQAQLAKNYDQLAAQLEGDSRELLLDVVQKTIDSMLLSGCQPIADEPAYDMSRHRPEPFVLAAPGTPIKRTVRQGVEWQGKVYIPAVVEL